MKPISIYIHWPFCLSLCPYCDFNSHVLEQADYNIWLQAYKKEIDYFNYCLSKRKVKSIFFGGGTPSLMHPKLVAGIIDYIASQSIIDDTTEITLEANPTSYETEKFKNFKIAGINRVSIGVQSFNDQALKVLGRKHSSSEAKKAIKSAAKLFERYSYDLIYAIPNQTLTAWQEELIHASTLAKSHISLYQLTIEKGTPFFTLYNKGDLILPENDLAADMYEWTTDYLFDYGYNRYEISNYATTGNECIHNLSYWYYDDYIGIGPGAHSRISQKSSKSKQSIMMIHKPEKWLASVKSHGHGIQTNIVLSKQDTITEAFMMGMRLEQGINEQDFQQITGCNFNEVLNIDIVMQYQQQQLLTFTPGVIKLTPRGLLLHSYLIPRMLITENNKKH